MYANPFGLEFWDFALLPHRSQINIVIGQLSRFEPELKNEDIENCPKIMENQDFGV